MTCQGAFGFVYKAIIDESTTIGLPSYLAAVKVFNSPSEDQKKEIFLEASIMAQLSHEHIVQLVRLLASVLGCWLWVEICGLISVGPLLRSENLAA